LLSATQVGHHHRWITSRSTTDPSPTSETTVDDAKQQQHQQQTTTTTATATGKTLMNDDVDDDDDSSVRIRIDIPNEGHDWVVPGAITGGKKLAAVFTCKVCETRSIKQFTEQAYTSGVVIVRCPGCQNQHVLADRLGYFDDQPIDLDRIARENGESLTTITSSGGDDDDVAELDLARLLGPDKLAELLQKNSVKTTTTKE
jgi:DNL zinc finger